MDTKRTLSVKMQELRNRGYILDFQIENGLLTCGSDRSLKHPPEQVTLKENHRFEGMSNPADLSILYAIETSTGKKGQLVDGYGVYNSIEVADFIRRISS